MTTATTTPNEHSGDDVFFDSDQLHVGDCWPRNGMRRHGAIVSIDPYPGDPAFAEEFGITGVATFANGARISIGGTFPGDPELVAQLTANHDGNQR